MVQAIYECLKLLVTFDRRFSIEGGLLALIVTGESTLAFTGLPA